MAQAILKTLEFDVVREILSGFCSSPLGRTEAERLEPRDNLSDVQTLLDQASEMKDYLLRGGIFSSRGALDATAAVDRALEMNRAVDPDGLCRVAGLLACSSRIRSSLRNEQDAMPEVWRVVSTMEDLSDLEEEINRTVDQQGRVLDTASEKLAALRAKKEDLKSEIRRRAEGLLSDSSIARWLQDRSVRLRNNRYVLPVRAESRPRVKGVVHGYSATGNTVFVEPEILVERQNRFEKLRVRENREVSRILWERTRTLIDFLEPVRNIQRAVSWLDLTYGRARYSIEYRLTAPEMCAQPLIVLRDARHPILLKMAYEKEDDQSDARIESARAAVVPLNVHLGERFDILVITGPNTGGKTVALKTTGLLALMAASGLHIPAAAGSRLTVFSRVLADIGDEQDIFQSLSTFSSHIKRIGQILDSADTRTLVLLDELGSGTDPQEGEALGRAILADLLRRGVKVLASTHLSKLKEFAFSNDGVENGCMEFNPDTLQPTFQLKIGMPGESNALRIALRLGVPKAILDEAAQSLSSHFEGVRELMDGIARARIQVEAELDRTREEAQDLKELKEKITHTQSEVAQKKAFLEEQAEREIDRAVRHAREEALEIVRKLHNVPAPHKALVADLEQTLRSMLERTPLSGKRRAYIDTLRKGDLVYIPRFREKCRVIKVRKKESKVEVEYRNMVVDIAFDEVIWPHWF